MQKKPDMQGIILLEILLAIFILAMSGSLLMSYLSEQTRQTLYNRDKELASWVADNVLVQARLQALPAEDEPVEGRSVMGNQRWNWQLIYHQDADTEVKQLQVKVFKSGTTQPLVNMVMVPQ